MPLENVDRSLPPVSPIQPELQKLGLSLDDFSDIALSAFRAYDGASPLSPVTFPGTAAWSAVVVALRASLSRHGWSPEDVNNQPQVVSSSQSIVITVSSGNEKTGVRYARPQTRGVKGTQTELGICTNLQFDMFEHERIYEIGLLNKQALGEKQYWIFLFFIDFNTKEVRSELSRPILRGDSGKVIDWAERIILPSLNFAETQPESFDSMPFNGEGAYEVNIPITSKDDE
ncbi:MAG: hypothetical protein HUJ18_04405 [Marinobacter sp.]|nr:hypothetical protein [Marinobacter sp.]